MTRALLLAFVAAIVLSGIGLYAQSLLTPPELALPVVAPIDQAVAEPPQVVSKSITATVRGVEGRAQKFEKSTQAWTAVQLGSSLERSDVLRTLNGTVTVMIGAATELEVSPDSRVRLGTMTSDGASVQLEEGLVSAKVQNDNGQTLSLSVEGTDTVATTNSGNFSVLRGKNAEVTVAGKEGRVTVTNDRGRVVVQSGEQTTAAPGQSPTPAARIPESLFVKLTMPGSRKLRTRHMIVQGRTTPGSAVNINGRAQFSTDGSFRVSIPLAEGNNDVKVVARDALGRVATKKLSGVHVDSKPPKIQGEVQW